MLNRIWLNAESKPKIWLNDQVGSGLMVVDVRVVVCLISTFFTEKQIDLKSVDLKKLKVRDLKKILNDWDEGCDGCLEKGDFIKRIEELKPKHIREEL